MKKIISMVLMVALVLTCMPSTLIANAATKSTLKQKTITLEIGGDNSNQKKIVIKNKIKKATYTFVSSNSKIAKVTKKTGKVTAVSVGETKITVTQTLNGKNTIIGKCKIVVNESKKDTSDEEVSLTGSLAEIIEQIYSGVKSELPAVWNQEITKENSSYYLGIENMEFEEAIASEAMISVIPFSVCLVRVAEGSDVEAIKAQIAQNANPRKWVCVGVEPENVLVDNIGNVIILIMSETAPQEIMNSFLSLKKN